MRWATKLRNAHRTTCNGHWVWVRIPTNYQGALQLSSGSQKKKGECFRLYMRLGKGYMSAQKSYADRKVQVVRLTTIDCFSELNDAWVKLRAAHEVMQARQAAAFQAMSPTFSPLLCTKMCVCVFASARACACMCVCPEAGTYGGWDLFT